MPVLKRLECVWLCVLKKLRKLNANLISRQCHCCHCCHCHSVVRKYVGKMKEEEKKIIQLESDLPFLIRSWSDSPKWNTVMALVTYIYDEVITFVLFGLLSWTMWSIVEITKITLSFLKTKLNRTHITNNAIETSSSGLRIGNVFIVWLKCLLFSLTVAFVNA